MDRDHSKPRIQQLPGLIPDEPTAALGVEQPAQVLDLGERLRERGLGVILINHNMAMHGPPPTGSRCSACAANNGTFEVRATSQEEVISAITGATDNAVTRRKARTALGEK